MSANVRSLVNAADPITGASRDDLSVGDVVTVQSVDTATTYSWTLAYRPPGSTAAFSGSVTASSPGTFTVDLPGPYLVRLTVDLSLSTENTQYVRLRALTALGPLYLTAAGEGYGGSLPVPVDQTTTGWADALNNNLTTLLSLANSTTSSGRVVSVDPVNGDYQSIQDAIDAVSASAGVMTPYVVKVYPGTYVEDLTLAPHVHVVGWPGNLTARGASRVVVVRGAHGINVPSSTAILQVAHLTLENVSPSTSPVLTTSGTGVVSIYRCEVIQDGLNPAQGAAISCTGGEVYVEGCVLSAHPSLPDDRRAVDVSGPATVTIKDTSVVGPTGASVSGTGVLSVFSSDVTSTGGSGAGFIMEDGSITILHSEVVSDSGVGVEAHAGGGALVGDVTLDVSYTRMGDVTFNTTGVVGNTSLTLGSVQHGTLTFPGGLPTTLAATTLSSTISYDPTSSGMTATDVQAAIDEVQALAVLVQTLDEAYDGGTPGSGSGRVIVADAGAVRISDAPSPSDPPPAGGGNGRLEVVGGVRVGAIDYPELDLDPNPYGSGPSVTMGSRVVPTNNPWGAGTATVQARSTGSPDYRNYNLRVQTQDADGGGTVGRLIVRAGGGLDSGVTTPDGGSLYLQAGDAGDSSATAGDVFLSPGMTTGGSPGTIYLVGPDGSTGATLTASGPCSDPLGVTGDVRFATSFGAVTASLLSTDALATVVSKLDALPGISASESGGILSLETDELGATAELYFLSADAGVDAALGGFDGVLQVDGTFAHTIRVDVTGIEEISIGTGGATGPLVYNSDTGKLTVPGVIDPTAIIFEEAGPPATTGTEGALFVSDGSSGLTLGALYYVGPSSGIPTAVVSGGGFTFPTAAVPSQTGEGEAVWDTNDDVLTIGDGTGRVSLIGDNTAAGGDLSGTYPNPTVTDLTITGEVQGSVLYFDGANWVSLPPSTAGHVLQTNGAGADPTWAPASSGSGDVVGPASSTSDGLARFSGMTGKLIKDTASWTLSDAGSLSGTSGSLVLPQGASAAPTTEGSIAWDTDDDLLKVGTGASTMTLVDTTSTQAITSKALTGVTTLGVRSTGSGAFDLEVQNTENLTGDRTLTVTLLDQDRLLSLSGDLSLSGGFGVTLTATATTSVTLPTSGTLVSSSTSAGGDLSGTYPNPTVVDLTISGEVRGAVLYFDGSGWESLSPSTAGYFLRTNGAGADPTWALAGDVSGPVSSTGDALARFDGITGKVIDTSTGWTLSDAGELSGASGTLTLPQGAAAAPTAEGSLAWDTDDDLLKIGTGAATLVMVDTTSLQVLSSKTLTVPTINGGTHTAITSLGVRSTGSGAFDLTIRNTENLAAGRALTLTVSDADRLLSLSGDLILSGGFSTTLTTTGVTSVTLPASGTLLSSTSAAGGDLSGTYPNPTVDQARGLRETSGPTTLTMGAVADGQVLRRVGSTIVGVNLLAYIALAGPLEAVVIPDGTATSTGTLV